MGDQNKLAECFEGTTMKVKTLEWYLKEYGEDWAEIVREEDIRQQCEFEFDVIDKFDRSTSWAFNKVSGQ